MSQQYARPGRYPGRAPAQHPTAADVRRYPAYYISGPGRPAAEATQCGHGYRLTDSCPCCP